MLQEDIVSGQVIAVLEDTKLQNEPRWDEDHEDWVCVLRKFVSGRYVTVVVGIDETQTEVTVITVY